MERKSHSMHFIHVINVTNVSMTELIPVGTYLLS